jgi:transcriptional regulator with XRE-family HTH domain
VAHVEDPRAELGRFLRVRRERLRPEDLGFPRAGRRRTPGLRREEVAVAAGISSTWYTYLEQGRAGDVSPAVLDSLARVLQLTEDERRHVHLLMYGHVVRPEPLADQMPINDLFRKTVAIANNYPYPVLALNRACDVIAWNDAAAEWIDDWALIPESERNFMLWLFSSERARQCYVDWNTFAYHIVGRWRADLARPPDDVAAVKRVAALRKKSQEFSRCWDDHNVQEHRVDVRRIRHPRLGIYEFYAFSLFTAYEGEGGVLFHIPVT